MSKKSLTLEELATKTGANLFGDPSYEITGIAPIGRAGPHDISFFTTPAYDQPQLYREDMLNSKAGALFIHDKIERQDGRNYLVVENPTLAFQTAIHLFLEDALELTGFSDIHPTAVIHSTATIDENVTIGPNAVVDKQCVIGKNTYVGAGCSIGPNTQIGENCAIHTNVTIRERCTLGNRVVIQPGSVVGSCGFGYTQTKDGKHIKLDQVGDVVLEDDVEIGSNTTIDRARFTTTRIRRGTKVDNLVQIAHGVDIGEDNLIIAQSGIAGSARTGKHVVLAAQSGVNGHVHLADGVILAGRAGASKSLPPGRYNGTPAIPLAQFNRNSVQLRNIGKYIDEIKKLKEELEKLKDQH